MDPVPSPDDAEIAFSAFTRLYVFARDSGKSKPISPPGMSAFHPAWSPAGDEIAFVSWSSDGGHVWRMRADGRGKPRQVSRTLAYYTDVVWSLDGKRILALRASSYNRLYREFDSGAPIASDLVWFPSRGGDAELIIPARGYSGPHFGPEEDRIYLYLSNSNSRNIGLISIRYDGSDRRSHLVAKGPGDYATEERVSAQAVRISPDGRHALIHHANQLYVAFLLNTYLQNVTLDLVTPELPLARLTDVGADFFGWSQSGETIFWSVGHQIYTRPLASIAFVGGATMAGEGAADSATAELAEVHEAVTSQAIEVYLPRYRPEGTVALLGATIIPMATADDRIEDGVVLIENDRIAAVGSRDAVIVEALSCRFELARSTPAERSKASARQQNPTLGYPAAAGFRAG